MNARSPKFNIMKGITILLVIVGYTEGLPFLLKNGIMSFHMPLFFLFADYFLSSKRASTYNIKERCYPFITSFFYYC